MSAPKGCKFCIRRGLPILPARPAIMTQDDTLPRLPATVTPPMMAQGEIAWTARLLREGFLYIWAESAQRWISYFATSAGYYYPLPEQGEAPSDILSGELKPCITQPEELASASLITLPVKPAGMNNGRFWFGWSEVEWTAAVRKKHEDAAYRSQYMQPFDMDAWLGGDQAQQAVPIAGVSDTLAEYSHGAAGCKARAWSPASWKSLPPLAAEQLKQAADALYAGKGAILLLEDPPAILQELSAVINYDLQEQVYKKPEYQRELALASAITALKESMVRQFERDHIENSEHLERLAIHGPFGYAVNDEIADNMYSPAHDKQLRPAVAKKWAEYEQYYHPEKVAAFQQTFNQVLTRYNDSIVSPRTDMYLEWLRGKVLLAYFQHNFDSEALKSGIEYVQTLNYCIAGMQDKLGVFRHFTDLLSGTPTDATNILARALVWNQDVLAKKLANATTFSPDWLTIPWSGLANAFKEGIEKMRDDAAGVAGIFIGLLSGVLTRKIAQALESKQIFSCLVAMGAITNKALIPLEKTGSYKQFVSEVVTQLAKESGLDSRVNKDRLRHYIRQELRRLRVDGLPMDVKETKRFLVLVDIDRVSELLHLPPKERARAVSKLLRNVADVETQQFSRWQGAVRRGVRNVGEAMPFTLGIVSGVLQVAALYISADIKGKKTLTADQKEAHGRFAAGVAGLASTTLNTIETGIKQFRLFTDASSKLRIFGSETFLRWIEFGGKFLGAVGGGIVAGFDAYHAYDEYSKGHRGLMIAYVLSSVAGLWLSVAMVTAIPVFGTFIAVVILIGTTVYLALNNRDKIQKWLLQCLWRRIPVNVAHSKEKKEEYRQREEADLPIWPTMQMEMDELKLALDSEI